MSRAIRLLLIYSTLVLLGSASFGFHSYDFFTLWGVHPKWVWATGNFWVSGLDLPAQIPYQSLFGSVLGFLLHALTPGHYPELIWNSAVFAAIAIIVLGAFRKVPPSERVPRWILMMIVLFMLKPGELKQTLLGGYSDLLLSLALWQCFECALLGRKRSWFWALFALLLKPAALSWLAVGAGAALLSRRSVSDRKALLSFVALPVALAIVHQGLRALYANHAPAILNGETKRMWQPLLSFALQVKLPFALLAANNGLALLAFVAYRKARREFWFLYLVIGLLSLIPFYIFLMGSTPHEPYASIHRYTLCLIVPPLFHRIFHEPLGIFLRPKVARFALGLLFVLCLLRTGEEAQRDWRRPWSAFSVACGTEDAVCNEAAKIRANPKLLTGSDCTAGLGLPTPYLDETLGRSASSLERLRLAYLSLPVRIYEEGHARFEHYVTPACRVHGNR